MSKKVLLLPGDGIGPEIAAEARKVLDLVNDQFSLGLEMDDALVGGAAIDAEGDALPATTWEKVEAADAILLGAVGGPKWDTLPPAERPEKGGLLKIRAQLDLFGNLRPAILYPQLAHASTLKEDVVSGLDILIVRELTGGIYFGEPRGIKTKENGVREGYNTYVYDEEQIRRIGRVAFEAAMKRGKRLCSVDKANVLEVTMLWREVMEDLSKEYPEVELSHMYVDNAAMQLIKQPNSFDVIVTGNLFGDILSDEMAMISGSLGMLPSASLGNQKDNGLYFGMYEPSGGSAPDIAGMSIANPIAQILSVSMMLRYSLGENEAADAIDAAVNAVIDSGLRTGDLFTGAAGETKVGTAEMGAAIVAALQA